MPTPTAGRARTQKVHDDAASHLEGLLVPRRHQRPRHHPQRLLDVGHAHAGGTETGYTHLRPIAVRLGQMVTRG